jgi:hypothetical protein
LIFFFQKEFDPLALSITNYFNIHIFIYLFILLLYEVIELFGFPVKLNFPSYSFKELPYFD